MTQPQSPGNLVKNRSQALREANSFLLLMLVRRLELILRSHAAYAGGAEEDEAEPGAAKLSERRLSGIAAQSSSRIQKMPSAPHVLLSAKTSRIQGSIAMQPLCQLWILLPPAHLTYCRVKA